MPSFKIEDAAFAGVGLLGRKPLAALAWALVWAVMVAIVSVPFAGEITAYVTAVAQAGGRPDPQTMTQLAPGLLAYDVLMWLTGLVVGAVVSSAVFRAILHPENKGFAYLRLGDEEIHVLMVNFVFGIMMFCVNIVCALVLAALMAIGGAALAGLMNVVGFAIVLVVMIWLNLRFSLAGPWSFAERRFRLFDAWALTRGIAGRLFAVAVIIALIGLVVYLALVTLGAIVGMGLWNSMPRGVDVHGLLAQPPAVWIGPLAPIVALISVLMIIGGAILTPIFLAPWAHIYRCLAIASAEQASAST
ncbi:MAG TPA: hypothetical protein VIJ59_01700 [Caulobacteraceae bacterium]